MTPQEAYDIINNEIAPEALEFFQGKQTDYNTHGFQMLGSRGQFSDINRKFWKLYRALWEGESLEGEQPIEICMDLIGHALLTIYCLRDERGDYDLPLGAAYGAGEVGA